jgi:hypothetical protein
VYATLNQALSLLICVMMSFGKVGDQGRMSEGAGVELRVVSGTAVHFYCGEVGISKIAEISRLSRWSGCHEVTFQPGHGSGGGE